MAIEVTDKIIAKTREGILADASQIQTDSSHLFVNAEETEPGNVLIADGEGGIEWGESPGKMAIFDVTYSSTTAEAVYNAYNSGKACFLSEDDAGYNSMYCLSNCEYNEDDQKYYATFTRVEGTHIQTYTWNNNSHGKWDWSTFDTNKVFIVNSNSTYQDVLSSYNNEGKSIIYDDRTNKLHGFIYSHDNEEEYFTFILFDYDTANVSIHYYEYYLEKNGGWKFYSNDREIATTDELDTKINKVNNETDYLAIFNDAGNLSSSGKKVGDFATSTQGSKADSALQVNDIVTSSTWSSSTSVDDKPVSPKAVYDYVQSAIVDAINSDY